MRIYTSLAAAVLLAAALGASSLSAQASFSTGQMTYPAPTTPGQGYIDDLYFAVDFGGTVTNCDLSIAMSTSQAASITATFFVVDELDSMTSMATLPDYRFGVSAGYTSGTPTPGVITIGSTAVWGPNGLLYPGNFPLTGTVRFMVHVLVEGASTFPNNIQLDFSTSVGTAVSNASYPITLGTGMGAHIWSQSAPGNSGVLQGYDRVSDTDVFQRNYSNGSRGVARFGNANDEVAFYIDIDLGTQNTTLDLGLNGYAFTQPGSATGNCVIELYDMQAGWDTPAASVTVDHTAAGVFNGQYQSYTTGTLTGLARFRVVMYGQNLQNVAYSSNFCDFGFWLYFGHEGLGQAVTNQPAIAPPRMAITPAATTFTSSPQTLNCSGGTGNPSTYNWAIQGTPPAGVSLSSPTGASTNLIFGATTPTNAQVTVRATNGATNEFAEETYTLDFGGTGGGGGTLTIVSPASLPNGSETVTYVATTITATQSSAPGPYTWSISSGTFPPGLVLDTASTALTTTISGTPTTAGNYSFDVQITNGSASDTQAYTVDISAAGTLTITTGATLTGGTEGQAYSANITCTTTTGPYSWSLISGTLPTGVTLGTSTANTVALSGTPAAGTAATYNFTIEVADNAAATDTQAFTLVIAPAGGGGPGGGGVTGGGGGGGGGCAADAGNSHWLALVGLLAMLGVVGALRTRKC